MRDSNHMRDITHLHPICFPRAYFCRFLHNTPTAVTSQHSTIMELQRGQNLIIMDLHNQLWISIIRIMDLHNSNYGSP